ncbi:uncharacterized protein LOC112589997 isoform X2 [Harpegnathos saltator]|uniref:uncharacterized protein LOC112589997 isoform X2 n=1 Tax=Harpegnathos saltator TaxID=610380 RepID=UPI000DBECFD4|nr:uncharacterized protein LOC112589997 isoform X2 [Harpegnathos saltator]
MMTYFSHPITDRKVTVFLDPCHCVKLLRNCIGEHKSIIDDNGDMIQWEHFTKLNDIQVKESLHLEITETATGNCIPLEIISILHVSANSATIINQSTPKSRVIDDSNHEDRNENLPLLLDTITLSEFTTRVIAYIAGFVVRHLEKILHCETCIEALTGNETHIECSLINIKNRGGLRLPSHDVIVICTKAEIAIRLALRESGDKCLSKKFTEIYLLNQVLQRLIENRNIFSNIEEHSRDQTILENHVFHFMRAIASKYIKIRLHFIGRNILRDNISIRQAFNKIVLFKGQ